MLGRRDQDRLILLPEVPIRTLFAGVMPFVVADLVRLGVLIAFPAITLTLPRYLG